jgi:endonuclease/exonuclease/phosphatase family metal-dependent hydrolase
MENQKADIWVLTETRLSMSPGAAYRCVASSGARQAIGSGSERWVSIWTSLPEGERRDTRDPEYAACAVFPVPSGGTIAVYGTVLPWVGHVWRGHPSNGARAFCAALSAQAQDWRELAGEEVALCVTGDFNQDLSERHYYGSATGRRQLRNTLSECGLTAVTAGADDPVRRLGDGAHACIDHVCLSDALRARMAEPARAWLPERDGRRLSDHPGITVELRASEGGTGR